MVATPFISFLPFKKELIHAEKIKNKPKRKTVIKNLKCCFSINIPYSTESYTIHSLHLFKHLFTYLCIYLALIHLSLYLSLYLFIFCIHYSLHWTQPKFTYIVSLKFSQQFSQLKIHLSSQLKFTPSHSLGVLNNSKPKDSGPTISGVGSQFGN